MNQSKQWIDFAELRKELKFEQVLRHYNIGLSRKGETDQYIGQCPLPNHGDQKGNTFSANYAKGVWQCFGCKQSGNVLDFAVIMDGGNKTEGRAVRKTAVKLKTKVLGHEPPPPARNQPQGHRRPAAKPFAKAPQEKPQQPEVVNQPLDFALKTLDREHSYFLEHKLNADTVERFGLGFCKRGALTGRIAVPLHNDHEELVGYAGLVLDESLVTEENPKYLFPANREVDGVSLVFDRGRFLYNGHKIGKSVKDIIVVQDCDTVWSLWQGGFANVVALMGDECSEDQAELLNLLTHAGGRIWLLTDKSDYSWHCAQSALLKIASSRLCRWVRFEKQSDIAPDHPLLELLPKR